MRDDLFEQQTQPISDLLKDLFEILAVYRHSGGYVFSLTTPHDREKVIRLATDRLKLAGYLFSVEERDQNILLSIDPRPRFGIPPLNIILFLLTLLSIYFVPVFYRNLDSENLSSAFRSTLDDLANGAGIEFTLALMSILFVHEMGHFIAGRRRNIITSWPYFIPAPNFIGTFGAIIKSKSPFWNRRDLIEVGAAGPIAGWIVAVGWLAWGLTHSTFMPASSFGAAEMLFSLEGESLLMRFLTLTLIGPAPEGQFFHLSEAAFGGWVGMLVTAINLLPIGQLDGGHILYGLVRKRQHLIGMLAMGGLIILGFQSQVWFVFVLFGLFFGVKHPPTLNDDLPLERGALRMAVISIIIMFLSFTPVPFR